jgi:hypothetical protein
MSDLPYRSPISRSDHVLSLYVQVPNAAFQTMVSKTFPDTATAKIMVACSVRPPLSSSPVGIVRYLILSSHYLLALSSSTIRNTRFG